METARRTPEPQNDYILSPCQSPLIRTSSANSITNKLKFKEKQMYSMNVQVDVQAVFIALLSQVATLSIGRPHRQSYKTKQFLKIKDITFNRFDTINILQVIQQRSKEQELLISTTDNTSLKTAKRRTQVTKRRETIRLLQDLLSEFGYFVEIEKENVDGFEGEITIYKDGLLFLKTEQVREMGKNINIYLTELLNCSKSIVVNKETFSFDKCLPNFV
ncbi:hypothetical protein EIN_372840 [Entamoeba invadens IP1]|uniref:Uncharacterized protein n=1 Tax=Entamoeba invadens IP1 TaxID=370355 RepID=A0A0A1TU19_ENTIV|nr:hypothetical protein EIN_372840 [Entamoeba invadens IP1]ELP83379.1 hypothetical protein EIN_372840 [Entamoeba invadens IP1]|eukprot:XP_004182725.1 hypothetical protein EIN_372840 [Entamoeba invadens IP1]